MAELLPCPFCGRKPVNFEHSVEFKENRSIHNVKVECSCGWEFSKTYTDIGFVQLGKGEKYNENRAFDIWNTRTPKERGGDDV